MTHQSSNIPKVIRAERIARDNVRRMEQEQREADEAAKQAAIYRARYEGQRQGERAAENLRQMMAHPVAEMMLREAGAQLGRHIAEKAEEQGTPGSIAIRCAEEVWKLMQRGGMPLEDAINISVTRNMERMQTEVRVDVPAMSFVSAVDDLAMRQRWC